MNKTDIIGKIVKIWLQQASLCYNLMTNKHIQKTQKASIKLKNTFLVSRVGRKKNANVTLTLRVYLMILFCRLVYSVASDELFTCYRHFI